MPHIWDGGSRVQLQYSRAVQMQRALPTPATTIAAGLSTTVELQV